MLTAPPAVALEGANGTGKTYLAHRAAALLGDRCHLLAELPDSPPSTLAGQVIAAMRAGGGQFLLAGTPRTETLLLAALHVHRHESLPALAPGTIVLEDRGPLSAAVYQGAVLHPGAPSAALAAAEEILALIARWRPLPARTLLLTDEPGRNRERFELRTGQPPAPGESALMAAADRLYLLMADRHPGDVIILDRRQHAEDQCVAAVTAACRAAASAPQARAPEGGPR